LTSFGLLCVAGPLAVGEPSVFMQLGAVTAVPELRAREGFFL